MFDRGQYFQRLGFDGAPGPSAATLCALHEAHLFAVPFENLDIHRGQVIRIDPDVLFTKIVTRHRGGFCYELNTLFALLLRDLGFSVTLLSARVKSKKGGFGPEFDHMALLVEASGGLWLADVGFGESFRRPMPLAPAQPQSDVGGTYRLMRRGDEEWVLESRTGGNTWEAEYLFTLTPRALADYEPMCHYHQTSPESHFTRNRIFSVARRDGRISLTDTKLIVHRDGVRSEQDVPPEAWSDALFEHFGVRLD
jgi:N-hydroxyarylamine O-acetyltransferase